MRGLGREVGGAFGEGQVGLDGGFVDLERKHILCAALTTFSTFEILLLCITTPPYLDRPHPRISFHLSEKFFVFYFIFHFFI